MKRMFDLGERVMQIHPNCKRHRLEPVNDLEMCTCEAWWQQEKEDGDRIAAMACPTCGGFDCNGSYEDCPEHNIELVRKERDAIRLRGQDRQIEIQDARRQLLTALGRDPAGARRRKPTLAELLTEVHQLIKEKA